MIAFENDYVLNGNSGESKNKFLIKTNSNGDAIWGIQSEKFRAFDKETGKVLWETTLPAGGYAAPSTYTANGKQYIIIAAAGGGKLATKPGDYYVAFSLE